MGDPDRWLLALVGAALCAVAMAVLVAGIALALATTGHDWYAAWKMSVAEAMIHARFDEYAPVEYDTGTGGTVTVTRHHLAYGMVEPWRARALIVSLIADRAVLGACTGLALCALWLGARLAMALTRRYRSSRREPAPRPRHGQAGAMRHPDGWSDEELIAALARRGGRLGVVMVPAPETGRFAGGPGDGAAASALPAGALAAPARALVPSHGTGRTDGPSARNGGPAGAVAGEDDAGAGASNGDEAGSGQGGSGQEFY